ncbi:MAG: Gldg family protein, partial [Candidatus Magasanikbacteria bacterium]|nr:Gldg family protein [Candidatus Magasanikbacteria bacterium]
MTKDSLIMSLKNIRAVGKKELRGHLDSPTAYIVLIVFGLLVEFLFFKQAFLVGEASLRAISVFLPWLYLLLIPAMSMGSVAEEKSHGTIEMVLTKPIRQAEFVLGKFAASVIFVAVAMLFLFPVAWSVGRFGNLDWGSVWGLYFAAVLLGSVLMSVGLAVSAMCRSTVTAFLLSAAAHFFLLIIGFEFVTASLPHGAALVLERLSALTHFTSMARGVLDLRDIWYAVSVVVVALSAAYLALVKTACGNQARIYRRHKLGTLLLVAIAILTNIVGSRIPGRIDLTADKLFTLTPTTAKVLSKLDDFVVINVYASKELPAQFQPILRDTMDMARDYERFSSGNVRVAVKDPSSDPKIESEAQSYGVRDVQFNVVGQEEFQVKRGYLGLAVVYAGKSQSIPLIRDTSDLEYQLTSFIYQLTNKNKKSVV